MSGKLKEDTKTLICGIKSIHDKKYDTILYIDVLEHIEDDYAEIKHAMGLLTSGGRIIIVSPAHNWLYNPCDKAVGHFRR